jgi:CPA2 family monovalent cation:H+ antiporter-2
VREGRYSLLRGFFHGADDAGEDAIESAQIHLRAVGIARDSALVARTLGSLPLDGARVSTVVRASQRIVDPPSDLTLQAGDTVVLAGTLEQISAGEDRLLRA